jgi:aspartokinase/homoserine dehydrogenase 1
MGEHASVLLLGTGVVGSALLGILQNGAPPAGLAVHGLANTRGVRLGDRPLDARETRDIVDHPAGATACIDDRLLDTLAAQPRPVLVDATASEGMIDLYLRALGRGIHVVTANKKPLAARTSERARLFAPSAGRLRYEATVGAGLPVIETLKDLVRTGDRIHKIECVLSGTLSFLANEIHGGTPLSRAVAIAKDRGYTEPDPREDLGGADVARKAVVLAREIGLQLETSDVALEPFVPAAFLAASSAATLVRDLERIDAEVAARVERLKARGQKLVYLARIDASGASAGPVAVGLDHPAATLGGSSALVAFTTARYDRDPLVVRGAGAGGAVTAAALVADVLRATS